jgi:hypothetical protein
MKRPTLITVLAPIPVCLTLYAPSVMGCVLAGAALVFGFCLFDQLLVAVRDSVITAVHRQSFKPPANIVAIGVILSVVCTAIGFFWNPHAISVPTVSIRLILTTLSIAGHVACLGAMVFALKVIQAAPNLRDSRG